MAKVIAIANEKGGVGKTTSVVTFADIMASWGHNVLVVDNDPQGHSTLALRGSKEELEAHVKDVYNGKAVNPIKIKRGLDLIGANKQLGGVLDKGFEIAYDFAESLDNYKEKYDYILLDCVPSTSYFLTASLLAAEYVAIPMFAETFSVDGLKEVMDTIHKFQRPRFNPKLQIIGVFLNCVPGKLTNITKGIIKGLKDVYGDLLFDSYVTRGIAVVESTTQQQSIAEYAPTHKLATEFSAVTRELLMRLEKSFIPRIELKSKQNQKEAA